MPHPTELEGYYQIPECHAKARYVGHVIYLDCKEDGDKVGLITRRRFQNFLNNLCPLSARQNELYFWRSILHITFYFGGRSCLFGRNISLFITKLTTYPGYIGEFEEVDDHRSGKVVIQLNGRLNKTGVISPRYNVALRDLEKWVVKLLPSRQFGYIVLTTSAGIMDHEEARRKHVAGKIIGFFY
jgi:ribosomal protein S8